MSTNETQMNLLKAEVREREEEQGPPFL